VDLKKDVKSLTSFKTGNIDLACLGIALSSRMPPKFKYRRYLNNVSRTMILNKVPDFKIYPVFLSSRLLRRWKTAKS